MGILMSRLSIQEDSRAPFGLPIALVDSRTDKILSCSRSVSDAEKHRAALLAGCGLRRVDDPQRFADIHGQCFPVATGEDALRSWADVHTRGVRLRYSPTEFASLIETISGALRHYFGAVPEYRQDVEDDDPDNDSGDDFNPDDDIDDDEEPDDAPAYSLPYVTMLGKPRAGELEQRRPWPPATPADRRPHR
jgi:hypothetical protein